MKQNNWIYIVGIVACVLAYIPLFYIHGYNRHRLCVFNSEKEIYSIEYKVRSRNDIGYYICLEYGAIPCGNKKGEVLWLFSRLNNLDIETINDKLRLEAWKDGYNPDYSYYYVEIDDDSFEIWKCEHWGYYKSDLYWHNAYEINEYIGKIPIENVPRTIDAIVKYTKPNVSVILFMKNFMIGFADFLMMLGVPFVILVLVLLLKTHQKTTKL